MVLEARYAGVKSLLDNLTERHCLRRGSVFALVMARFVRREGIDPPTR
jgi:hypothetical protein